jgi:hypothetical protein
MCIAKTTVLIFSIFWTGFPNCGNKLYGEQWIQAIKNRRLGKLPDEVRCNELLSVFISGFKTKQLTVIDQL